jgi:2'-5' RNA ligase
MRAFLAVDLNESLQNKVLEVQKQLTKADAPVKFVERENLHFTCKFLGDISDDKADKIAETIREKIQNYPPFEILIKGAGVFPHLGYIRVIWLGLEDAKIFSDMLMDFDEEFIKMGFRKERSYIPHLTIGRVKGAQNKEALVSIIKELEDVEIGAMKVERVVLKKSELTPVGPIYTTVEEFEL